MYSFFCEGRYAARMARRLSERKRGADQIVAYFTELIVSGRMQPDEKLPSEGQLCEQFSVSRTVIREAIQQLKARGAIRTLNGKGSYVSKVDLSHLQEFLHFYSARTQNQKDWLELLALRALIETECVRELCKENDDAELGHLADSLKKMQSVRNDLKLFAEADIAFHYEIVKLSNNRLFKAVWSSLRSKSLEFALATYQKVEQVDFNIFQHQAIYEAISSRDVELATKAVQSHLKDSKENLMAQFND